MLEGRHLRGGQRRMGRERRTVEAMIRLYCLAQHGNGRLCAECEALQDYAWQRLETCPFQAGKNTCAKCPVHCYKPEQRASIRAVMRYAGPRMLFRHPVLALFHLLDGLRKEPTRRLGAKVRQTRTRM
jgi:hypothetical protein